MPDVKMGNGSIFIGKERLNTRFLLPTLPCAGYSVKLNSFFLSLLTLIRIVSIIVLINIHTHVHVWIQVIVIILK